MFGAVLDTCVLVPSLQRDFLLSMAAAGVYRPLWSEKILEELQLVLVENPRLCGRDTREEAQRYADHLLSQMREQFGDALVPDCARLLPAGLPDPDDEHVLAAAVLGHGAVIVTENEKDFTKSLLPGGLLIRRTQPFIEDMVSADPFGAADAVRAMAVRSKPHLCSRATSSTCWSPSTIWLVHWARFVHSFDSSQQHRQGLTRGRG